MKRSDLYRTAAERLSARLRPAWERMEQQANRPKCLYCTFGEDADFTAEDLKKHIESECDFHPLRAIRADLAACVEALERAIDYEELTAQEYETKYPDRDKAHEWENVVAMARAALARVVGRR